MAKFGIFGVGENPKPLQVIEGEWLEVAGDMVCIRAKVTTLERTLAVVRINPGQSVKKID